jgi:hypothetical protein
VIPRFPPAHDDATHLVQRMIERKISWPEVVAVVRNPDKMARGHSGRKNCFRVVGRRRLRVTIDGAGIVWTIALAQRSR